MDYSYTESYLSWSQGGGAWTPIGYEIEYSNSNFVPGTGAAAGELSASCCNAFVPLNPSNINDVVYVRAVCDCTGPSGYPDGDVDEFSDWVLATVTIGPPPNPDPCGPDDVSDCDWPLPEVAINYAYECGENPSLLSFSGSSINEEPMCSGESEFTIWRKFQAPANGEVHIQAAPHNGEDYVCESTWDDFGISIRENDCSEPPVYCQTMFSSADTLIVAGLVPGEMYRIGLWANDFDHHPALFNYGFSSYLEVALNICQPNLDCYQPSQLTVSAEEDHAATLHWDGAGGALWTVEYGPAGFTPGTGIVVADMESTTLEVDGLDSETQYEFYVSAADCDSLLLTSSGPESFSTDASMTTVSAPDNAQGYCCAGQFELPESFDVSAYCEPITFSHVDSVAGAGCDFDIIRTITAHDNCGNQLSEVATFNVISNDLPCGCDTLQNGSKGKGVALDGDWAFVSSVNQGSIYKHNGTNWVLHAENSFAMGFDRNMALDNEVFVTGNKVYRLDNDVWQLEQTLYSSASDSSASAVAIQGNEIAMDMGPNLVIFEHDGAEWIESAIFNSPVTSLEFDNNFLVSAYGGLGDTIASVFDKSSGSWAFDQFVMTIPGGSGNGIYGLAVNNGRLAIGHWYLGGIYTYLYDGAEWQAQEFITNPYLDPDSWATTQLLEMP